MTRRRRPAGFAAALVAFFAFTSAASVAFGQTPADAPEAPKAPRPPEGERIINLPSAEVPQAGTLTMVFTHRFSEPLQDSDFHSLWSFDSGADIGLGLAYTPFENFEVSFYRSSHLDDYELDVKYRAFSKGPFTATARLGGDWRSERHQQNRNGVFAQAILGVSIGSRVRVTAVPTYVSKTAFTTAVTLKPFYEKVFNVPVAVSVSITRTFNVQGELTPRIGRADSTGVGWVASIEKTVPKHRFAFTVGNQRATTVDQYVTWTPQFFGQSPHPYFIGFNIVRQWKL
jgi:hypothetical protein